MKTVHDVLGVCLPSVWVGDGRKSEGYNYQFKSIARSGKRQVMTYQMMSYQDTSFELRSDKARMKHLGRDLGFHTASQFDPFIC